MGIRITIDGEGEIIIKRRKEKGRTELEDIKPKHRPELTEPAPRLEPEAKSLIFLRNIIDQMEIRAESVFRPNQEDYETAYALSGNEVIDMLHKFTSREVIKDASPMHIYTVTENKVKHILEERGESPRIIIDVHTHPYGIAELSDEDRKTIKKVAEVFKEKTQAKIYFGVHAVSDESFGKRREPEAINNRIRWRSITREHEVAFFDENGKPVKVKIWEQ